jgi:hypothetical protein
VIPNPVSNAETKQQGFQLGLDEHCRQAVFGLRAALIELYGSIGADIDRPQEVSRQFKLDKSLTWKISKILRSDDAFDVVSLIPGAEGITRLLNAMTAAGASGVVTERVRSAMREFDTMVQRHAGDRATLDLVLDSMHPGASMQESRRLAFLGNSGILGLQTRVRFATRIIAPSRDNPSCLDFALITGVRDLRRLRGTASWPIYRFTQFKDDLTSAELSGSTTPLEDHEPRSQTGSQSNWLMPSWCSSQIPSIRVRRVGNSMIYELVEGPVGRTGETNLTFGYLDRGAVSRFATDKDKQGHFATGLTTPSETMLIDFFVHRSLPELEQLQSRIVTTIPGLAGEAAICELPIPVQFSRLAGRPPQAVTQLMSDYHKLIAWVFERNAERCGWDASEFYGMRMTIEHPPLHATVLSSYDLPVAPA